MLGSNIHLVSQGALQISGHPQLSSNSIMVLNYFFFAENRDGPASHLSCTVLGHLGAVVLLVLLDEQVVPTGEKPGWLW